MQIALVKVGAALLAAMAPTLASANAMVYSYDTLGRVTRACHALTGDGELATYTYDAADNRSNYNNTKTDKAIPPNSGIRSPNGRFTLWMQPDSNLVLYDNNNVSYWSTSTTGKGATVAYFQSDGNLVLYNSSNTSVWYSNTANAPCSILAVANDGNVTITSTDGVVVWQTNTGGH